MSIVNINSKDRINPGDDAHYEISLSQPLNKSTAVSVISAILPYSWYNLPEDTKMYIRISNVVFTLLIPSGNYNVNQLMAKFTTLFNALGTALTATLVYEEEKDYITFSFANGTVVLKNEETSEEYWGNRVLEMFGLNRTDSADLNFHYGNYSPNVSGSNTIELVIRNLALESYNSSGATNQKIIIPCNANPGELINFDSQSVEDIINFKYEQDISSLDIFLQTPDGKMLGGVQGLRGQDLNLRLKFFF